MILSIGPLDMLTEQIADWQPDCVVSTVSRTTTLPAVDVPHLVLRFQDIEGAGVKRFGRRIIHRGPHGRHVVRALEFIEQHSPARLLLHCVGGLSRSPALAIVAAAAKGFEWHSLATVAPWAQPNRRVLALGFDVLGHDVEASLKDVGQLFPSRNRGRFGARGDTQPFIEWCPEKISDNKTLGPLGRGEDRGVFTSPISN